jgi:hypothetical protein
MSDKTDKPVEGRTAYIEKNMPDGMLKKFGLGVSRLADKFGFTQEKEYKGKSMEELEKKPGVEPVKKAKGGKISSASSRADGCAQRGKTRGRMV